MRVSAKNDRPHLPDSPADMRKALQRRISMIGSAIRSGSLRLAQLNVDEAIRLVLRLRDIEDDDANGKGGAT